MKANNSLAGTLPTEIGLAKALKVLDIRKCANIFLLRCHNRN